MKNDWDFYNLALTATREERERAMFRAKDEQEDQKK